MALDSNEIQSVSLCTAFSFATAQQLLPKILINPTQPRSDLFSDSESVFMK